MMTGVGGGRQSEGGGNEVGSCVSCQEKVIVGGGILVDLYVTGETATDVGAVDRGCCVGEGEGKDEEREEWRDGAFDYIHEREDEWLLEGVVVGLIVFGDTCQDCVIGFDRKS